MKINTQLEIFQRLGKSNRVIHSILRKFEETSFENKIIYKLIAYKFGIE